MATSLEEFLALIDLKKVTTKIRIRINEAINSFMEPVKVTSWESFEYYMLIFVAYLDEHVPFFEPAYIFVGHPWDRCVRLFDSVYGNEGEEVAFDIARTGNNGGLSAVMWAVALKLADEYAKNEILARIKCYWKGLSLAESVLALREYISKYGHLLPLKLTEENASRMLAYFPEVLRKHPWAVRKYATETDIEQTKSEHINEKNWVDKLELLLAKAGEAEAKKEFLEAERLFRLALYCEGRLRPDVTDAKEYALKAGPVYKPVGTIAGPEITREQS